MAGRFVAGVAGVVGVVALGSPWGVDPAAAQVASGTAAPPEVRTFDTCGTVHPLDIPQDVREIRVRIMGAQGGSG